jgi:hypothetical protein
MIFKVVLNQIFSNFNTMLWTIKYRLSSITVYFTFTVPELWPFFSYKIGIFLGFRMIFKVPLNQIFSNNLYLIVHSIVLHFEKIWLSTTLNIIRKPKKSLFSKRKMAYLKYRSTKSFANFNTMLWTIKYRISSIMVYFTFTVPELCPQQCVKV